MSNANFTDDDRRSIQDLRNVLDALTLQEVRLRATKNFGLKISRDLSKDDIIGAIVEASGKFDFAQTNVGDLKPGYSRIKLHPVQGKSSFPVYFQINGYQGFIPFNVEVDVPTKVVKGVLHNAVENRAHNAIEDKEVFMIERGTWQQEESYPFSLIETRPGPDPKPGLELVRDQKLREKREFLAREGYWPNDADVADIKKQRMMKRLLDSTETAEAANS